MSARRKTAQDGRKRRAEERRTVRRAEMLRAALAAFSDRGYHRCSVSDIIEAAGVARGTFYLYFTNKRAVFDELLDRMLAEIAASVRRVRTGEGAEPALDQMLGNVRRVIEVVESNRELSVLLLREAGGLDEYFDRKIEAFYASLAGIIERALLLGQQMGIVRSCDAVLVSRCILGSVKEVLLHVLAGEGASRDREALARQILEYNFRGIAL
jgi:AcrR family transcriptional regulator